MVEGRKGTLRVLGCACRNGGPARAVASCRYMKCYNIQYTIERIFVHKSCMISYCYLLLSTGTLLKGYLYSCSSCSQTLRDSLPLLVTVPLFTVLSQIICRTNRIHTYFVSRIIQIPLRILLSILILILKSILSVGVGRCFFLLPYRKSATTRTINAKCLFYSPGRHRCSRFHVPYKIRRALRLYCPTKQDAHQQALNCTEWYTRSIGGRAAPRPATKSSASPKSFMCANAIGTILTTTPTIVQCSRLRYQQRSIDETG